MATTVEHLDVDIADGIERNWYKISGVDYGTEYEFDSDVYAVTSDGDILDCDGYPLVEGDRQTIAVRNAIEDCSN